VGHEEAEGREGMKTRTDERFRYPAWSLPVVEFANGKKMQIPYVKWERSIPGLGEAFVWHMPLRLAWATSIHRSQGQTLNNVSISLDDVFESGQAYVAISRATSLDGLVFSAFDPKAIRAHPRITDFYTKSFTMQRAAALGIMEE
jgi:ATP-dependent DNA helicase PIF1